MNKETRRGLKWLLGVALVLTLMLSPVAGLLGFSGMALADISQNVTINATPAWVSISNTPGTFDFGTVKAGVDEDTTLTGFNVTNGGSVACNITLQCDGWTNLTGTNVWTYGAAAENTSQLKAGLEGGSFDKTIPNGSTVQLTANLTAAASQEWGIEIDAPSAFTHGDVQQTTVTMTAALHEWS